MTRRRQWLVAVALTVTLMVGLQSGAEAVVVSAASPPAQPAAGPGSTGPCGTRSTTVANPRSASTPVHVYEPTGSEAARIGGGRCDGSKRPAVFIAHGVNASDPATYFGLVHHLVSTGNVVVFPTYAVNDGDKSTIEEAYRVVDAGIVAAAKARPRIDTSRVGWWGHSMGGSMIPYLVQRGGLARRWGRNGIWMSNVAQTFALLVGPGAIEVPAKTQVLTIGFEHDELADNRIGIEVFHAIRVPAAQKRHVMAHSDAQGLPPLLADHFAPSGTVEQADALDFLLWRDVELVETCALAGKWCGADYGKTGSWSNGIPALRATVSDHPADAGPYPAILAECDGVYGQQLNQARMHRCGATHL